MVDKHTRMSFATCKRALCLAFIAVSVWRVMTHKGKSKGSSLFMASAVSSGHLCERMGQNSAWDIWWKFITGLLQTTSALPLMPLKAVAEGSHAQSQASVFESEKCELKCWASEVRGGFFFCYIHRKFVPVKASISGRRNTILSWPTTISLQSWPNKHDFNALDFTKFTVVTAVFKTEWSSGSILLDASAWWCSIQCGWTVVVQSPSHAPFYPPSWTRNQPTRSNPPFTTENHGLRLGGADSHPICFTLDCKLPQFWDPQTRHYPPWQRLEILSVNITESGTRDNPGEGQRHRKCVCICAENIDTALNLIIYGHMARSNGPCALYSCSTLHKTPPQWDTVVCPLQVHKTKL